MALLSLFRRPWVPQVDAQAVQRSFRVTRPIDAALFDEELSRALGWDLAGLVLDGDPSRASARSPVQVQILGGEVDPEVFYRVLDAHQIPGSASRLATLLTKAETGTPFDESEIQYLLRYLLRVASG